MSGNAAFVERVKGLGFNVSQFVVIGSGILDAYGIRHADDIDLVVTDELFKELASRKSLELTVRHDEEVVSGDINGEQVEVWRNWMTPDMQSVADLDYLLQYSTEVDGVRLVSLDYIEAWKKSAGRDKDLRDLELIAVYRKEQNGE